MFMLKGVLLLLLGIQGCAFSQVVPANPVRFQVNKLSAFQIFIAFEKVSASCNYLVISAKSKFVNIQPTQGKIYQRGDQLGNAKVIQFSSDTIIEPRAVRANTLYYFAVYSSQLVAGKIQYQFIKPLFIEVLTSGLTPRDYYESVSISAPNFLKTLSETTNSHTVLPYSAYKNTLLTNLEIQDTISGKSFVECVYSGERKVFTYSFDWTSVGYSREHTFAHSWMPSHPADNPPLAEYSDLHNLYPTNLDKANTVRNNFPLGEVTGTVLYSYLEGRLGYSGSQIVYEPRFSHKGNAARALLYMIIAYNGINNHSWMLPPFQNQEVLKKWHFQDPPDNYEISRQEYIYSLQGNRNPFIDHPEYVCYIDFTSMMKINHPCSAQLHEISLEAIEIRQSMDHIKFISRDIITKLHLFDLAGNEITMFYPNEYTFEFNKESLISGVYLVHILVDEVQYNILIII